MAPGTQNVPGPAARARDAADQAHRELLTEGQVDVADELVALNVISRVVRHVELRPLPCGGGFRLIWAGPPVPPRGECPVAGPLSRFERQLREVCLL